MSCGGAGCLVAAMIMVGAMSKSNKERDGEKVKKEMGP